MAKLPTIQADISAPRSKLNGAADDIHFFISGKGCPLETGLTLPRACTPVTKPLEAHCIGVALIRKQLTAKSNRAGFRTVCIWVCLAALYAASCVAIRQFPISRRPWAAVIKTLGAWEASTCTRGILTLSALIALPLTMMIG